MRRNNRGKSKEKLYYYYRKRLVLITPPRIRSIHNILDRDIRCQAIHLEHIRQSGRSLREAKLIQLIAEILIPPLSNILLLPLPPNPINLGMMQKEQRLIRRRRGIHLASQRSMNHPMRSALQHLRKRLEVLLLFDFFNIRLVIRARHRDGIRIVFPIGDIPEHTVTLVLLCNFLRRNREVIRTEILEGSVRDAFEGLLVGSSLEESFRARRGALAAEGAGAHHGRF